MPDQAYQAVCVSGRAIGQTPPAAAGADWSLLEHRICENRRHIGVNLSIAIPNSRRICNNKQWRGAKVSESLLIRVVTEDTALLDFCATFGDHVKVLYILGGERANGSIGVALITNE